MTKSISAEDVLALRTTHYNASIASIQEAHDDLRILRIIPDGGIPGYKPGQYLTLGVGNWEPRIAGVDEEHLDDTHHRNLSKRAYSISCSILDDRAQLVRPANFPYLEFYISLVRHGERHPPALTPRLFAMKAGDRIFVEGRATGHYTLEFLRTDDDAFFFATGTGEAPHNAMIAELLARGHAGRIVGAVCVRRHRDAAYRAVHRELAGRYSNYRYNVLTTREPENLDSSRPDFVGKRYLQDVVQSGDLERETGVPIDPSRAHVFLCGSPDMIGTPRKAQPMANLAAEPGSMLALLGHRGFRLDEPKQRGNVHFERYW